MDVHLFQLQKQTQQYNLQLFLFWRVSLIITQTSQLNFLDLVEIFSEQEIICVSEVWTRNLSSTQTLRLHPISPIQILVLHLLSNQNTSTSFQPQG